MTKRLTFKYADFLKGTKGTTITGDNSSTLLTAGTLYIVKTIDDVSSGLPTGVEAGYIFEALGTEVLTTEDSVIPFTTVKQCDIQNASLEFTKEEIDITTLCDEIKKYADGLPDASGSADGITTLGITDQVGGFLNKFVALVKQNATGDTVTVTDVDDSTYYLQLKINNATGEEQSSFFLPVKVLSTSATVSQGEAQTFSMTFRPTEDDDLKIHLFNKEVA